MIESMETNEFIYMIHVFKENPDSRMFEFSYIYPKAFATAELAQKFLDCNFYPCSKDVLYSIFKMNMIKE